MNRVYRIVRSSLGLNRVASEHARSRGKGMAATTVLLAALSASGAALATTYTGTTDVNGDTVNISTGGMTGGDTITQPSEFVISNGGILNLSMSGGTALDLGVVQAATGGGTINNTSTQGGDGYSVSGGDGYVASQNTGTLAMDSTTANDDSINDILISGDQSLEASDLVIAGPYAQDLEFGEVYGSNGYAQAATGTTTEDLTGGIQMGDSQTANQVYGISENNAQVTLGSLSMDSLGGYITATTWGGAVNNSSLDVENGTLAVSGTDGNGCGLLLTSGPSTTFDVNLDGSTVDVPYGVELDAETDVGMDSTLNFDAENTDFEGQTSLYVTTSALESGAPAPVINANLDGATVGGSIVVSTTGSSQTPSVTIDANNATIDGNVSMSGGDPAYDGAVLNSNDGYFGSIAGVESGTTANLENVQIGGASASEGDGADGDLSIIQGTLNANGVTATGATNLGSGLGSGYSNLNILSAGLTTGTYSQISGNLSFLMTPSSMSKLTASQGYNISGGNVIIHAAPGTYTAGLSGPFLSSNSGASNTFNPTAVYYVYNGADSSKIDGYAASVYSTASSESVCLGGSCGTTAPSGGAGASTPTKTPAPANKRPAPTPASAPTPAPTHIQVHVVTPVQETKHVVTSAPTITLQQARDASQVLVSTGVVGGGPRGLWIKGLGGVQSQAGGYSGDNYGLIAGYGFSIGPDKRDVAGVAFSYGQSNLGTSPADYTSASDYALWGYGTYYPNASRDWKLAGTVGAGLSSNSISSTSLGLPQVASFGGHFLSAEVRASYWKTVDGITVSPRVSLGYTQSWTNGFNTQGASFLNVHVHNATSGQFYVEPAVLVGKKLSMSHGKYTLFPQVRAGLMENVGPTPSALVSSGQVAAQVAGIGYPHTQGMAEVRLDVFRHSLQDYKGFSGNLAVRQLFGGGASQTEAIATLKYHW